MASQSPMDPALVTLHTGAGDEATFSLHGAQLLSWVPAGEARQLYLSPLARPAAGKALRGGVPVCFPQFSDRGPLPKHGFVRTSRWELVAPPAPHGAVTEARFQIDSASAGVRWDHAFALVLVARLGPGWIELQLQAANTGRTAYDFTAALHTYLGVDDVRGARLHGLRGCTYEDNLAGLQRKRDDAEPLAIAGEVDRVYLRVPGPLRLEGGGAERHVVQHGFPDTVVWNPGPAKAAQLGDMPPADWTHMLCIEAAAVGDPVTLAPGKTWHGMQRIELPQSPRFDASQVTPDLSA